MMISIPAIETRTAYKSMKEAEVGEEQRLQEATPSLKALGLKEATEVVKAYLAAPNWEKKLEFVRQPESARPRMMQYYRDHPGEDGSLTGVEILRQNFNSVEGGSGFLFECRLANDQVLRVPAVRILSEAPFYGVDWETLVDYADVGWEEFLTAKRPGSRGIFRLYGAEDDFYAFRYADSSAYLGLQLYGRAREVSAHGYVARGSETHAELQAILMLWKRKHGVQGQPASTSEIKSMVLAKSDDPQRLLKAMIALQELEEPDETADDADLFGDKNLIKPELWTQQAKRWVPMTLEVGFHEDAGGEAGVQLEILRFLSPNWIVGESLIESEAK